MEPKQPHPSSRPSQAITDVLSPTLMPDPDHTPDDTLDEPPAPYRPPRPAPPYHHIDACRDAINAARQAKAKRGHA